MQEHRGLPYRNKPRPPVTRGMPHTQIGVHPVPALNRELFRRAFALPGVRNEPTQISVPGARALWLDENLSLTHDELILVGREFAHIHPDGSLHVTLDPQRAQEATEKGWAEPHPIASQIGVEGMVLLYTPLNETELDVIFGLVVDSYNFITGRNLQPEDILVSLQAGQK